MSLAPVPYPPGYMPAPTAAPVTTAPAPERRNDWVELMRPAAELASQIAPTDFVPAEMRNKPEAVAACILYGAEIGIGPMMALAKVDIVKGRPAPRAELARALALAAGHEVWVEDQSNTRCTVKGRRRGSAHVYSATWTTDDVRKAMISSAMYSKYPRQMLLARASAELVRMMAPDVLGGIAMFSEELDDPTPDTVPATVEPAPKGTTRQRTRRGAPAPEPQPQPSSTADDDGDPPLDGDEPRTATDAQIMKMQASFNELGVKTREDRLAFIAAAARPVPTSKDLTVEEASKVIDVIGEVIAGRTVMTFTEHGIALELSEPSDDGPVDGELVDDVPPLEGDET